MRRGIIVALLVVVAAAAAAAAGCSPTPANNSTGGGSNQTTQTAGLSPTAVFGIVTDWSNSMHRVPVAFATQESPCVKCHDGRAFQTGVTDPAQLKPGPGGPYYIGTDCAACHTANGAAALQSGTTTISTSPNPVSAGAGALCLKCHNEISAPTAAASPAAAHPSCQAGVLYGTGGIKQAGVNYGGAAKHSTVKDLCIHCHMTDKNGVASHTFKVEDFTAACSQCHQNVTSADPTATADFDGNGQVQGFQDEIGGLLSTVASAAAGEMNATTMTTSQGRIVFKSGNTTLTASIPEKVYQAAYNWSLINDDGSMGVHNPRFAVTLLQQSYLTMTGKPVPNAKPWPSTGTGGGGASGTTTGSTGATAGAGTTGGAATTGGASGSAPTSP